MQNRSNSGGFIPALSNWTFDLPCESSGGGFASCGARNAHNGRGCRGGKGRSGNAAPENADVGPVVVPCTGKADCTCDACAHRHAACAAPVETCKAPCEAAAVPAQPCNATPYQPCAQEAWTPVGQTCPVNPYPSGANAAVGMVYAAWQTMEDVYDAQSALAAGTLFPELYKPLNGYCPQGDNCATCQQETAFALWELRLYLNTHPNDARAQAMFRALAAEAGECYATAFLPDGARGWNWVDCPWPWEIAANDC